MQTAYLDNSATTRVCAPAAERALYMMTQCYGNPSSLHSLGAEAFRELETSRRAVARLIGARPEELTFTSGGTEANNLAVLGAAASRRREGRRVVTTAMEHASVAAACDELERQGFEVIRLAPGRGGLVDADQVERACDSGTVLVSVMLVNNETGALFPLKEIAAAVRRKAPRALIHCDAVQAAGKLEIRAERLGVDLMTVSGHKLHAPKGIGGLYIRKGVRVLPRAFGGEQERGLRPGTEPAPLIAAFGAAAEALPPPAKQEERYRELRRQLLEGLRALGDVRIHEPASGVPYILNVSLPGYRSETLLHFLAERGVYVSSGSACSRGKKSPVLTALGLPPEELDSALRISFCYENTPQDIRQLLEGLAQARESLIRVR